METVLIFENDQLMDNPKNDGSINWLTPLFVNAGGDEIVVGVNQNNDWFIKKKMVVKINDSSEEAALLPLMEEGYGGTIVEVRKMLSLRLESVGLDCSISDTFPYIVPVRTALKNKMGYWIGMASNWIDRLEFDLEIAEIISSVIDEKWVDQKYRHLLKSRLKKWEKKEGYVLLRK